MSTIVEFPIDRQVVSRFTLSDGVDCITLDDYGDQLFVTDRALGEALGYPLPSVAIEWIVSRHVCELARHALEVDLAKPGEDGRQRVWAFDLDGAMRICKYARTPSSPLVYAWLAGRAIADFAVDMGSGRAPAKVLPFGQRKVMDSEGVGQGDGR